MLEAAFVHGEWLYGLDDVKQWLLNGTRQLWLVTDNDRIIACGTTVIMKHEKRIVCEIPEITGTDLMAWKDLQDDLGKWALAQGCQELIGYDRGGWARVLGWERMYTVIRKRLDG